MKSFKNERVFCFTDLHAPYHHPDALSFLRAVKDTYDPDRVINLGDELDNNAISFHQSDPELFSATMELDRGRKVMQEVEKIFPHMIVIKSNHGSLVHRRVVAAGLPRGVIKSYQSICGVGDGWSWHFDYTLTLSNKQQVYFIHNRSNNVLSLSRNMGMNVVQGHHHSKSAIGYWANPNNLFWGLQLGCLFDPSSRAFAYNRLDLQRPLLTAGIILNGYPRLLPMVLKKSGRWSGRLV